MEYMTAKEAAQKWNITVRRVQVLCSQGRIQGASYFFCHFIFDKR